MAKIIILKNGKRMSVIREDEKYLYVKGSQFRSNHPDILEIIDDEPHEEGFDKLPNMEEIEKEMDSEEKMIENIKAESDPKAKEKAKKGE